MQQQQTNQAPAGTVQDASETAEANQEHLAPIEHAPGYLQRVDEVLAEIGREMATARPITDLDLLKESPTRQQLIEAVQIMIDAIACSDISEDPPLDTQCIGCGCTEFTACHDRRTGNGCRWLIYTVEDRLGVCSCCSEHVDRFAAGDRELRAALEY